MVVLQSEKLAILVENHIHITETKFMLPNSISNRKNKNHGS